MLLSRKARDDAVEEMENTISVCELEPEDDDNGNHDDGGFFTYLDSRSDTWSFTITTAELPE